MNKYAGNKRNAILIFFTKYSLMPSFTGVGAFLMQFRFAKMVPV
jgi:hypothetical protein